LNNDATLIWDADNDGDNNDNDGVLNDSTDVTVIAPRLVVEKDVSVIPSDTGDPLEYTIVIRHTNASDAPLPASGTSAYDVTFNDVLPAGVDNPTIVSALDSTGAPVPGFTLTGSTISHTGFDLLHNDYVTLMMMQMTVSMQENPVEATMTMQFSHWVTSRRVFSIPESTTRVTTIRKWLRVSMSPISCR